MDFSEALREIKANQKLCRKGWNGKNMFVSIVHGHKIGLVEIGISMSLSNLNTNRSDSWVPSISDLFADDWEAFVS